MAITKTDFINYSRCPRYAALDEIKKEKLEADVSYKEYKEKEQAYELEEILGSMYETDEEGNETNLIDVVNPQLEAMLSYYRKVEQLAAKEVKKMFGGKVISSENTTEQESFDFSKEGIKYLCYVDVYNEVDNKINIVEVKATTSKKYEELGKKENSIFIKQNNIYHLKDEVGYNYLDEMTEKEYELKKNKLFDRTKEGKYIYDLAIQRYIIENEYKQSNNTNINNINYYLAVLNHKYVYDGESDYETDFNNEEIITLLDMNKITKFWQDKIEIDAKKIARYILTLNPSKCDFSNLCEYKKTSECKFFKRVCGKDVPKYNSVLNYMNNGFGFKDEMGNSHVGLNLLNEGYKDLLDIPDSWIKNPNHVIQRNCYVTKKPFMDINKIKAVLNTIEYPIYHLDFETFPCPVPRFRGEKCYEQSPFEFSLHIEHAPGVCDNDKDNYVFLAKTFEDEREDLVKMLCELITKDKGTLLAQNVSFEKRCLKRLGEIYPKYQDHLMNIYNRGFDLLYVLRGNSNILESLGYNKEETQLVNYYDYRFSGSYSIKKTLPVFSDLSYSNLEVKNGTEAIREYASYPTCSKEEIELKRNGLIVYCKQDTWAMVVILNAIRSVVNKA